MEIMMYINNFLILPSSQVSSSPFLLKNLVYERDEKKRRRRVGGRKEKGHIYCRWKILRSEYLKSRFYNLVADVLCCFVCVNQI